MCSNDAKMVQHEIYHDKDIIINNCFFLYERICDDGD